MFSLRHDRILLSAIGFVLRNRTWELHACALRRRSLACHHVLPLYATFIHSSLTANHRSDVLLKRDNGCFHPIVCPILQLSGSDDVVLVSV